jgi:DNA topoisomerase II
LARRKPSKKRKLATTSIHIENMQVITLSHNICRYTKKTQLEHILLRPDTYIGSIEKQVQPMWVLDAEQKRIVFRPISYVPGLYKIFDEIMVNAADNKQRDSSMNRIDVTINAEENSIRVWNNGSGIPIVVHKEHNIYVPELIFGNLLTGSNFDDAEAKTTGGRNGYGAKLANIFSTRFIVETADQSQGLKYKQEFSNNMNSRQDPVINKYSGSDFTCITFFPDLERFKMAYLDEDVVSLLAKRVYDIAGTNTASGAKLNVYLNGERLDVRKFEDYLAMYDGIETPVAFERVNDRWEVGVGVSDGSFQQVSFVNSISTSKGGCHVNYIADQITSRLLAVVKKKNKGEEVKPNQIKNHLAIFVNALIVNPAFDSQTKENLTTKSSAFGSTCIIPDKMLKTIEKSNIIDNILNWAKFKQTAELKKKSGTKKSKLIGITKLDDANFAGTSKSNQCTLILTEGDSAKALAISGLGVVGRDFYGVFPLRGKLLNVREASHAQIMKNEEIQNISKILGLNFGKDYQDTSSLRYGHLMIMTDQDHDGSHIKGLLINFLHYFWPSLLQIDGFLQQFITPIVKCSKGKKEFPFYTIPQYHKWKADNEDGRGWKIKYYKGLGTSTAAEAKEYFSNLDTHEIDFEWDDQATDMIDMAFAKKRVEDRKLWLLAMEPGVHIDYDVEKISYDSFVNRELILFSHADNGRSIAHFMDGFKPSQRKVLFACFKRNLKQEIKVAQLAGYVSEHSAYHHGEQSLTQTIIGMAQNFVGSNNINLLSPCGQFGTRLMGGKDAASPRYVFTKLETITRVIFHPDDDALLEYLEDDGQLIEPEYYVPVIPMALVNGSEGIGTGWSSSIPTFNPREIIQNLRRMIDGQEPQDMMPWFRGFHGDVQGKTGTSNFTVTGTIEVIDEQTVVISELPVGKWTTDYKQFLESVLIGNPATASKDKDDNGTPAQAPFIKDFKENHTDTVVLFTVTLAPEKLIEIQNEKGGLVKKFKIDTSVSTTNMNLFDLNSQIKKFDGALPILRDFFNVRMQFYDRRKSLLTKKLTEDWERLDNKMKFLLAVINGEIAVSNRKKVDLLNDLKVKGFKAFYDRNTKSQSTEESTENNNEDEDKPQSLEKGYDYLLSMKLWNLTMEKVNELISQRNGKRDELETLMAKTAEMLWLEDLEKVELALDEFDAVFDESARQELIAKKRATKKAIMKGNKTTKRSKKDSENDDDDDEIDVDSDFEEKPKSKPKVKTVKLATTVSMSIVPPVTAATATAVVAANKPKPFVDKKSATEKKSAAASFVEKQSKPVPTTVPPPKLTEKISETMNLFERLKLRKADSISASIVNLVDDVTAAIPQGTKPESKAEKPKRMVAVKKKPIVLDSETENDDSVFGEDDDDDDFMDSEDEKPKKAKRAAPTKKTVSVGREPAVPKKIHPIVVPVSPPMAAKGVKRAQKSSVAAADPTDLAVYSPAIPTPKPMKKPRTKKDATAEPARKPVVSNNTKAKNIQEAAKKPVVRKLDSDDEFDEASPIPHKSPKPIRQRKVTNYAKYYSEDDDDEEDSFIVDDESDFDDDDD